MGLLSLQTDLFKGFAGFLTRNSSYLYGKLLTKIKLCFLKF